MKKKITYLLMNFIQCSFKTLLLCYGFLLLSEISNAQLSYTYGWEPTGLGNWSGAAPSTGGAAAFARSTSNPCSGLASVRANAYYDNSSMLSSPSLGTSNGGVVTLGYTFKITEFSSSTTAATAANVQMDVQWASTVSGPWTTVQTINSANYIASTSCANQVVSFSANPGDFFIRFLCKAIGSSSDLYYYIDDVSITQGAAPTCFSPTNMSTSNISTSNATINWAAPASSTPVSYEWEIRASGTPGSGSPTASGTVAASVFQATASNLASGSSYTAYVRSLCGGSDFSSWSALPFITALSNNEASGAIALTVNPNLSCAATTAGTTTGATQSTDADPSCSSSGINDDVWYKFTATSVAHQFSFTNVASGTMAVALYTGTSGALVGTTDCNSGATVSFTDLVPNTQYYARLYTTSSSSTLTTNFTVCLGTASNMTYDSVTTTQSSTSTMLPGATGQQIVGVRVYTANGSNPLNATQFNFTTSGTITAGEITSAKLYYTGTSSSFASTTLFGTAVANPNGAFSIVGSQSLTPAISGASTSYFWLVYDINCSAVAAHTADAICNSVTVGGTPKTPIVTDPTGSRAITALTAPVFTSPTAGSVVIGTTNLEAGRINITGSNCVTSVSEVKFNVGVSPSADIAQAKCYYTTTSSGVETTTPFGSAILHPTGDMVFSGTQAVTSNSSNYFWLAYDVDCASTTTTLDSLFAIPVSITSSAGVTAVAPLAANKKKGIVSAVAYVAATTTNVAAGAVNLSMGRTNISGNACYNTVTQVKFNTASSVSLDISQAKCYYTTSNTFATTTPFGSAVVNPSGDITFTGSQSLAAGTGNYFWLAYDVSCTAVVADSLVAIPVSITADNSTVLVTTPSSNQKKGITASTGTAPSYTATTTTSVIVGSTALAMGRSGIFGSSCVNNVTQVKFNTSSSPVADITAAKCYYTTTTTFSTATPFGTAVSNPNGDIAFNGSLALAPGTGNYFWLAYDVACSAVLADSLVAVPVNITANGITTAIATPATNAKKGIIASTVYNSIADGDWSSPGTWACGAIPSATSNVSINNNITVTTAGNVAANVTVIAGKTFTISGGSLTMGASGGDNKIFTNNGTLTVSGGTFNINGQFLNATDATFNQSGGNINVDPNAGTGSGTSLASTLVPVSLNFTTAANCNLTGGTFTLVDPQAAISTASYAMSVSCTATGSCAASPNHTFRFGDGVSTDAGGTLGFTYYSWSGSGVFRFGKVILEQNTANAATRFVLLNTTYSNFSASDDITIRSGAELRQTGVTANGGIYIGKNLTVETGGTITTPGFISFSNMTTASSTTLTLSPSTNAQVVSGGGVYRNATSSPTANFGSLTINNTSTAGVTFDANSLLSGVNTGTVSSTFTMTAGAVNVGANALVLGISPSSTGTYSYAAGMIVGKFKRWLSASTGSNAFDLGSAFGSKKAIINFTTAPTTGGSLTASFNTGNPGSNGLPLTEGSNTYTNASALGYWTISAGDGLAGGTYTATLTGAGFNDVSDYTKLAIGKRATSSDPWALVGVLVAPTGSNSNFVLSRTGMTGFSDFAILNTQVPLEIKLVSFTGYNTGTVNNLNWTTASERDASHFKIMRSENGKTFEAIGKVDATNKTSGSKYNFVDENPLGGKNFYQLSMVDRDGHSLLSNVIELSSKVGSGIAVTVHPNPVSNLMQINIAGKVDGKATILILDIVGKVIKTIVPTGSNVAVDMSNMPAGTYVVKYMDSSNALVTKIIKN